MKATKSCMMMTCVDGTSMDKVFKEVQDLITQEELEKDDEDKLKNAYKQLTTAGKGLSQLTYKWVDNSMFGSGFYHGDLHSGNIMINNEGNLTLIDYGNSSKIKDTSALSRMILCLEKAGSDKATAARLILKEYVSLLDKETADMMSAPESEFYLRIEYKLANMLGELDPRSSEGEQLDKVMLFLQQQELAIPGSVYNFTNGEQRLENSYNETIQCLEQIEKKLNIKGSEQQSKKMPDFSDMVKDVYSAHKIMVWNQIGLIGEIANFIKSNDDDSEASIKTRNRTEIRNFAVKYADEHSGLSVSTSLALMKACEKKLKEVDENFVKLAIQYGITGKDGAFDEKRFAEFSAMYDVVNNDTELYLDQKNYILEAAIDNGEDLEKLKTRISAFIALGKVNTSSSSADKINFFEAAQNCGIDPKAAMEMLEKCIKENSTMDKNEVFDFVFKAYQNGNVNPSESLK